MFFLSNLLSGTENQENRNFFLIFRPNRCLSDVQLKTPTSYLSVVENGKKSTKMNIGLLSQGRKRSTFQEITKTIKTGLNPFAVSEGKRNRSIDSKSMAEAMLIHHIDGKGIRLRSRPDQGKQKENSSFSFPSGIRFRNRRGNRRPSSARLRNSSREYRNKAGQESDL